MNILNQLLSFLFPTYCLNCEQLGPYLCENCSKELQTHPDVCIGCHRPTKNARCCLNCRDQWPLAGVLIGFTYNDLIKQLIYQSKYQKRYEVINFLAEKLVLLILSHPPIAKHITNKQLTISYVPMHRWKKRFIRGFNQSELLAQAIAKQLGLPCQVVAKRIKHTKPQMKKSRVQRVQLSQDIFTPSHQKIDGPLLIIDDITTTGSTLKAIVNSLRTSGYTQEVRGCVLARHN